MVEFCVSMSQRWSANTHFSLHEIRWQILIDTDINHLYSYASWKAGIYVPKREGVYLSFPRHLTIFSNRGRIPSLSWTKEACTRCRGGLVKWPCQGPPSQIPWPGGWRLVNPDVDKHSEFATMSALTGKYRRHMGGAI